MTDLDSIFITVRRCNMSSRSRSLRSPLTDLERQFVLRRVGEEKSALQDLLAKRRPRRPELVPTLPDDALAYGRGHRIAWLVPQAGDALQVRIS